MPSVPCCPFYSERILPMIHSMKLPVRVTALYPYASFAELYAHLPLTACGYAAHELADAAPSDMDAYYPPEEQARWGVLGIGVALWQSPVFPLECG